MPAPLHSVYVCVARRSLASIGVESLQRKRFERRTECGSLRGNWRRSRQRQRDRSRIGARLLPAVFGLPKPP
ncbi:hypothetical protein MRX96_012978 [Rhipicephalus microplus]